MLAGLQDIVFNPVQAEPSCCTKADKKLWIFMTIIISYSSTTKLNRLHFALFGFMNNLASHLERSPLIHSYGYDSADDRPTWLLVSSMRLAPKGACAINLSGRFIARLFVSSMRLTPSGLTRYFVPDKILPLNSKSFMQNVG